MLRLENLTCGYGETQVVRSLSFNVKEGEVLSFIGPNGAGKTSTLLCLMGLVLCKEGSIFYNEKNITSLPSEQRIKEGISLVPEGRRIFPDLSIFENLMVGGHTLSKDECLKNITKGYDYFPILKQRKNQLAGSLSGGEQQMLAMARALMVNPRLLLVDEISLGLMPKIVDECYEVLKALKGQGLGIILVEQNTEKAIEMADHIVVLEAGNAIWKGSSENAEKEDVIQKLLI